MSIQLPEKIRIIGKTYTVEEAPESPLENRCFGRFKAAEGQIILQAGMCDDQVRDTLIHEALHGIDYAMSLDLEEPQVHALAAGVCALFRDNPALLELFRAE